MNKTNNTNLLNESDQNINSTDINISDKVKPQNSNFNQKSIIKTNFIRKWFQKKENSKNRKISDSEEDLHLNLYESNNDKKTYKEIYFETRM